MLQRRTIAYLGLALAVTIGGALVVAAVSEWSVAWHPFRGAVLGFFVGAFGASTFWTGLLFARAGTHGGHAESRMREARAKPAGETVSPKDAKRWLQKFLEEQQIRETQNRADL